MLGRFVRVAAVGAAITVPIGAYAFMVRPWMRRWGIDATEAATLLPGDDVVPDATAVETRGITIDAAVGDVWPWLVQMGFGRAGFYSYDQLDMKGHSATEVKPEWQQLAVGDTLPTHPGGGFTVRALEPEHALVVYVDSEMAATWTKDARPAPTAGIGASGAFLGTSMPTEFAGTWAWIVKATPKGDTRLIERIRFRFPADERTRGVALGALGFGMFVMMRKQMLGIRDRAERLARTRLPAPYAPPVTASPTPA